MERQGDRKTKNIKKQKHKDTFVRGQPGYNSGLRRFDTNFYT